MAALWFLLSLFYFAAALGLVGCGLLGLFMPPASSPTLVAWSTAFRSGLLVGAALVGILYGALFTWGFLTAGWRESLRDSGAVMILCTLLAALFPFCLRLRQARGRPAAELAVAIVAFLGYGWLFLLFGAGA